MDGGHEESQVDKTASGSAKDTPRASRRRIRPIDSRRFFRAESRLPPTAGQRLKPRINPSRSLNLPRHERLRSIIYYLAVGLTVASLAVIAGTLIAVLLGLVGG